MIRNRTDRRTHVVGRATTKARKRARPSIHWLMVQSAMAMALSTGPSLAACSAPNSLSSLKDLLLPPSTTPYWVINNMALDDENFAIPPKGLKFISIDTATGNFTGKITFGPNRNFSISGKLAANGGPTFSISFFFTQTIGVIARPTDPVVTYTGALRAFVEDPSACNESYQSVRYHIAGTFKNKSLLSVVNSAQGPAPFSGTGYTIVMTPQG